MQFLEGKLHFVDRLQLLPNFRVTSYLLSSKELKWKR